MSKHPSETYVPEGEVARANAFTALEQFRQSLLTGTPLSIEWLAASLEAGVPADPYEYHQVLRDNEADHEKAIKAAGGPFDASYNPPPQILGEEGAPTGQPLPEAAEAGEADEQEKPKPRRSRAKAK